MIVCQMKMILTFWCTLYLIYLLPTCVHLLIHCVVLSAGRSTEERRPSAADWRRRRARLDNRGRRERSTSVRRTCSHDRRT